MVYFIWLYEVCWYIDMLVLVVFCVCLLYGVFVGGFRLVGVVFVIEYLVVVYLEYCVVEEIVCVGGYFEVVSLYVLVGDQLVVIDELEWWINLGECDVVLFGVIGIGKLVIIVWLIECLQWFILVMVFNKMLVVQLVNEL